MNKRLLISICTLTTIFFIFNIFPCAVLAEEKGEEDIEKIKALFDKPGDFNIEVDVEGKEQQSPIAVDATTTFVITRTDGSNKDNRYKFYYFFGGGIRRVMNGVLLPYQFTQTFKGLSEGSYELGFVLIDVSGKYGSCKVIINVKHKGKSE